MPVGLPSSGETTVSQGPNGNACDFAKSTLPSTTARPSRAAVHARDGMLHSFGEGGRVEEDEGEGDPTRGCCGHRKCYLPGTRFEHCCFVAARLDHMGECDGDESPGSEWSM